MRTKFLCLALLVAGLTGNLGGMSAPCLAQADASPFSSQPFEMDGTISQVDGDRDRVTFDGDDGRTYTLDTATADIRLRDGKRGGMTADLAQGLRIHVSGQRIATGIAEIDTLNVLPPRSDHSQPPVSSTPANIDGADIELRGTVSAINTRLGSFIVKVSTHTRTVFLADDTDLTGMALKDPNRFPVKLGDRVTVAGRLQPDGGVLAGAVSLSKTIAVSPPVNLHAGRVLFGRISSVSSRFTSRDIKIRLTDDREVKIKVPRGLSIRRDGRTISVHDLHTDDDVRVLGNFDGSDFKAERIDVLHHEDSDASSSVSRRGL